MQFYLYERSYECFKWKRSAEEVVEKHWTYFVRLGVCVWEQRWTVASTVGSATMKRNSICVHENSHASSFVFERNYFAFLAFSCCCFNHRILRQASVVGATVCVCLCAPTALCYVCMNCFAAKEMFLRFDYYCHYYYYVFSFVSFSFLGESAHTIE